MTPIKFKYIFSNGKEFKNTILTLKEIENGQLKAFTNNIPCSFELVAVCQFTGLKVKNDIEIYKGDIVIYYKGYVDDSWTDNIQGKHGIVGQDEENGYIWYATFIRNKFSGVGKLIPSGDNFEVIGNIYENKELLEE
ncbi:YopX family protein [Arcobacter sp.]|uniref:YopX family protein n=1 Tax=unclassified Arcobacter TaxID=2593671 RepID=UPI003B00E49D